MDQKPASRSRGRKNEEEPTTTTTTRNTNKNNNEVEEDALTKAPSFVRIDAADEEMRAAKRSARHVSSNSRRGPSAFTAAGAVSVPPPSSRLLSLAPAVHGEEDVVQHDKKKEKAAIEEGDAERNSKDIERAIRDHNDGTPSAVGAVKMNGQEQGGPASVAELLAKSKEGEKSSSFVLHDHDHAPEAFSVVAELATDTDELEKERDELRRQLSMERRQKSDVIVASAVVRLASTNNLNPNEYSSGDITDEETKNNKNKKFLLYGLVCLLVVGAAVAAGVVVGGLGGDPTNLARPLSPEEELFFPSAGLPIGKLLLLLSLLYQYLLFHSTSSELTSVLLQTARNNMLSLDKTRVSIKTELDLLLPTPSVPISILCKTTEPVNRTGSRMAIPSCLIIAVN